MLTAGSRALLAICLLAHGCTAFSSPPAAFSFTSTPAFRHALGLRRGLANAPRTSEGQGPYSRVVLGGNCQGAASRPLYRSALVGAGRGLWGGVRGGERRACCSSLRMGAEQGVILGDGDLEKESKWLENEITQWLDDEWIPRDIHRDIGIKTAEAYVQARERGVSEVGDILMAVANAMMNFDFYEADVAAFDIANKVSDLLLQADGRDVCCTSSAYCAKPTGKQDMASSSGGLQGGELSPLIVMVPEEVVEFEMPETAFEKYQFLQQALDGRIPAPILNWAVLQSLGYKMASGPDDSVVYDASNVQEEGEWREYGPVPDFVGNTAVADMLEARLEVILDEQNKKMEDLDSLLEALYGEVALQIAREEGDVDFLLREICVKWLHFVGGY